MPYRDEAGVKHVSSTDPISDGARLHLLSCSICKANFPNNAKQIRIEFDMPPYEGDYATANETPMRDRRFVEDDLMQLAEVDDQIRNMLAKRESIVNDIKKAIAANTERVNASDDWFEGDLKGNPVPARGMNDPGPTYPR